MKELKVSPVGDSIVISDLLCGQVAVVDKQYAFNAALFAKSEEFKATTADILASLRIIRDESEEQRIRDLISAQIDKLVNLRESVYSIKHSIIPQTING